MSYLNMSDVEREVFKKDIEIALVKKWWPLAAFMFAFGMFAVKGTNWFDNNIATKQDVQELKAEIKDLKTTMISYAQSNEDVHIKLNGGVLANRHSIDSLSRIVANTTHSGGYMTQYKRKDGSIGWRDLN